MYREKKRYNLGKRRRRISYLQNDNKMVLKIWSFTYAVACPVIRSKFYPKSIANYQNKCWYPKILNLFIGGDAKSDSREIE